MANFKIAHSKTAINEGLYVNDPDDTGGETWKGIARKKHPNADIWPIIDSYKKHQNFPKVLVTDKKLDAKVDAFYIANFWSAIRGNEIMKQKVADSIYDSAVNMGVNQAIRLAQRALGIAETGLMDKKTLDLLNA